MTDSTEEKTNKIDQMRINDVDVVLRLQEILLSTNGSSGLTPSQLTDLFSVYGELYHSYAMSPHKWLFDV